MKPGRHPAYSSFRHRRLWRRIKRSPCRVQHCPVPSITDHLTVEVLALAQGREYPNTTWINFPALGEWLSVVVSNTNRPTVKVCLSCSCNTSKVRRTIHSQYNMTDLYHVLKILGKKHSCFAFFNNTENFLLI